MNTSSFTDEQLLNLINNAILTKTEFKPSDFTGGSVQVTSTHSNKITNYKVSLFFGYTSKKPITRTIEINKETYYIWSKAVITKVASLQNDNVGLDFNEINSLMNISPSEVVSSEVDSNIVVSRGNGTTPSTTPSTIKEKKKSLVLQIAEKLQASSSVINRRAFDEWMEYKKYKTIAPITKTISFLNEYDFETQQKIVDTSIMNGYKGLFEPKQQRSRTDNNVDVAKSWLDENDFPEMCKPKVIGS